MIFDEVTLNRLSFLISHICFDPKRFDAYINILIRNGCDIDLTLSLERLRLALEETNANPYKAAHILMEYTTAAEQRIGQMILNQIEIEGYKYESSI